MPNRVADLERDVAELRRRVEVMRWVSRDVSFHVNDDEMMVNLVVDDVLAAWTAADNDRSLDEVWHTYANRIEYDDPDQGLLRRDICDRYGDPTRFAFDTEAYLHDCWIEHCEVLSITAAQPSRRTRAAWRRLQAHSGPVRP